MKQVISVSNEYNFDAGDMVPMYFDCDNNLGSTIAAPPWPRVANYTVFQKRKPPNSWQ